MIWLTSEFLYSFRAPGDREVIIDKKDVKVREQLGKDIGTEMPVFTNAQAIAYV